MTIDAIGANRDALIVLDGLAYKLDSKSLLSTETRTNVNNMGFTMDAIPGWATINNTDKEAFNRYKANLSDHESKTDLRRELAKVDADSTITDKIKVKDALIIFDFLSYKLKRNGQLRAATKRNVGNMGFITDAVPEWKTSGLDKAIFNRYKPELNDKQSSRDLFRVLCKIEPAQTFCPSYRLVTASVGRSSRISIEIDNLKNVGFTSYGLVIKFNGADSTEIVSAGNIIKTPGTVAGSDHLTIPVNTLRAQEGATYQLVLVNHDNPSQTFEPINFTISTPASTPLITVPAAPYPITANQPNTINLQAESLGPSAELKVEMLNPAGDAVEATATGVAFDDANHKLTFTIQPTGNPAPGNRALRITRTPSGGAPTVLIEQPAFFNVNPTPAPASPAVALGSAALGDVKPGKTYRVTITNVENYPTGRDKPIIKLLDNNGAEIPGVKFRPAYNPASKTLTLKVSVPRGTTVANNPVKLYVSSTDSRVQPGVINNFATIAAPGMTIADSINSSPRWQAANVFTSQKLGAQLKLKGGLAFPLVGTGVTRATNNLGPVQVSTRPTLMRENPTVGAEASISPVIVGPSPAALFKKDTRWTFSANLAFDLRWFKAAQTDSTFFTVEDGVTLAFDPIKERLRLAAAFEHKYSHNNSLYFNPSRYDFNGTANSVRGRFGLAYIHKGEHRPVLEAGFVYSHRMFEWAAGSLPVPAQFHGTESSASFYAKGDLDLSRFTASAWAPRFILEINATPPSLARIGVPNLLDGLLYDQTFIPFSQGRGTLALSFPRRTAASPEVRVDVDIFRLAGHDDRTSVDASVAVRCISNFGDVEASGTYISNPSVAFGDTYWQASLSYSPACLGVPGVSALSISAGLTGTDSTLGPRVTAGVDLLKALFPRPATYDQAVAKAATAPVPPSLPLATLFTEGKSAFDAKNYSGAIAYFAEIKDRLAGGEATTDATLKREILAYLGWSYLELAKTKTASRSYFGRAAENLTAAMALFSLPADTARLNALRAGAGWAIIKGRGNYAQAANYFREILALAGTAEPVPSNIHASEKDKLTAIYGLAVAYFRDGKEAQGRNLYYSLLKAHPTFLKEGRHLWLEPDNTFCNNVATDPSARSNCLTQVQNLTAP